MVCCAGLPSRGRPTIVRWAWGCSVSEPYEWKLFLPIDVGAHVNEYTVISHRIYPREDRVTVNFSGTNQAQVALYLPRPELHRLRDILSRVVAEFETERAALFSADGQPIFSQAEQERPRLNPFKR